MPLRRRSVNARRRSNSLPARRVARSLIRKRSWQRPVVKKTRSNPTPPVDGATEDVVEETEQKEVDSDSDDDVPLGIAKHKLMQQPQQATGSDQVGEEAIMAASEATVAARLAAGQKSSSYVGVSWRKESRRWNAKITHKKRDHQHKKRDHQHKKRDQAIRFHFI